MRSLSKILPVFIFLLCLFFSSFDPIWKRLAHVELQVKIMEIDHLGNAYLVSKTNQLYKYSAKGELLSTLNYAYLGNITHLDCSNPMEIYLFYKELNAIVFLDNNLAFRGKINLSDFGITQATVAGRAYDNGIWLFDLGDMQLKKMERDGKVSQQSGNSMQLVAGKKLFPEYLKDNGSLVFLNDSTNGILVFDAFANYLRTIPIVGKASFSLSDKELSYFEGSNLIRYRLKDKARDTLTLPETGLLQAKLFKSAVYVSDSNQFRIYSFE